MSSLYPAQITRPQNIPFNPFGLHLPVLEYGPLESAPKFQHIEVDIGDPNDPLFASDYIHIDYRYMRDREKITPESEIVQEFITVKERNLLIDWMCQIHCYMRFNTNTFYISVGILDRVLSQIQLKCNKLKCLGCACLYLASKFEELRIKKSRVADKILSLAKPNDEFTLHDILRFELDIYSLIGYDLSFPTPLFFMTLFLDVKIEGEEITQEHRLFARYLLELAQTSENFIGVLPSAVAASAVAFTRIVIGLTPVWPDQLIAFTCYLPENLASHVQDFHELAMTQEREESRFIAFKYGNDAFLHVAQAPIPEYLPEPF